MNKIEWVIDYEAVPMQVNGYRKGTTEFIGIIYPNFGYRKGTTTREEDYYVTLVLWDRDHNKNTFMTETIGEAIELAETKGVID